MGLFSLHAPVVDPFPDLMPEAQEKVSTKKIALVINADTSCGKAITTELALQRSMVVLAIAPAQQDNNRLISLSRRILADGGICLPYMIDTTSAQGRLELQEHLEGFKRVDTLIYNLIDIDSTNPKLLHYYASSLELLLSLFPYFQPGTNVIISQRDCLLEYQPPKRTMQRRSMYVRRVVEERIASFQEHFSQNGINVGYVKGYAAEGIGERNFIEGENLLFSPHSVAMSVSALLDLEEPFYGDCIIARARYNPSIDHME